MLTNDGGTILVVDDDPGTARLHQRHLERAGYQVSVAEGATEATAIIRRGGIELAVLDYRLSSTQTGLQYYVDLKEAGHDLPVIMVTGFSDQATVIEALRLGVRDFVTKTDGYLTYLPEAVRRVLKQVETERDLAAAQDRIQTQAALLNKATNAVFVLDLNDTIRFWNHGAQRLYGWLDAEIVDQCTPESLFGKDRPDHIAARQLVLIHDQWNGELCNRTKDGREVIVESHWTLMRDDNGMPKALLVIDTDVTEKKQLEAQLRQSQKMEAVGQLAGGVAHDFNNLLTIILGYSDLLLHEEDAKQSCPELLGEISKAAMRAALLTRQLLAFSRKQVLDPKILDLNAIVADTEKMFRRLIGENIQFATRLAPNLNRVLADPGQIEQVILNLVVNARDAMPCGGEIHIETKNISQEQASELHLERALGAHVELAVTDTGCGMDEATKSHIFEPFFTTKPPGKGTGLGLATVFGIVKQSGGQIVVHSELKVGTTFRVFLPVADCPAQQFSLESEDCKSLRGTETVLIVEDDESVRALSRRALQAYGYAVLEASQANEAIRIGQNHQSKIDLLLSDVIMPQLNGRQLAELMLVDRPEMKVLYVSGYTDDAIIRQGIETTQVSFLQKPFTPKALALKVREVLSQAT